MYEDFRDARYYKSKLHQKGFWKTIFKISPKNSSGWSIAEQVDFNQFYLPHISLLNSENRSSLSCSYQKLFIKQTTALYFEMDSSYLLI